MSISYLSYFFRVLLLSFILPNVYGQTPCKFQLKGHIHCKKDYTPLIGATVQLIELNLVVQTNEEGVFILPNICEGTYTLKCNFIGYKSYEQKISIDNTQKKIVEIYLEHENTELQAVEVQGIRTVSELHTQATNHLIGKELDQTKGQVLGEALKKIVGVTTIQTGVSIAKPVIQGLHSNRVLIMNNGVRQEGQQWGAEHAPEIDPFVANQLTVIKGAASVRYGADAMGGVVLIEPKPLIKNNLIGGEINLVGFSNTQQGVASAILEGKLRSKKENNWAKQLNHLYWRGQGTFKQAGTVRTPNYYLRNTGFEERNFSYNLGWLKENIGIEIFYSQFNSSIGIFSGSHFGNLSDLNTILAKGSPDSINQGNFTYNIERPYQRIEHELFKAKAYYKTPKVGKFSLIFARQFNYRAEFDKHFPRGDSLRLNTPQMAFKITTHTAELTWEHLPKKGFYGIVGVNGMVQNNTYNGRFFIPFFRNYTAGAFAIEHLETGRWHLEAGLRFDYRHLEVDLTENRQPTDYEFLSYDFHNLSGTLGAKYQLLPHWELGSIIGMAWRPPSVNEMFSNGVHHGAASVEVGNRNLKNETAFNFSINSNYKKDNWNIDINLYQNYINNYIYLNPEKEPVLTVRGAFPLFTYQQGNVVLRGLDFSGAYTFLPRTTYQLKASFIRAYNYTLDDFLILMPADRYEHSLNYELKDIGKLSSSYIEIAVQQVMKQNRVPANTDYAAPPSAYTLVNMQIGTTLSIKKSQLSFGIGVQNVMNVAYRDYLNRFRYFADEIGRNISIKTKFSF
jgi:iron complex outermembrane receptor protein